MEPLTRWTFKLVLHESLPSLKTKRRKGGYRSRRRYLREAASPAPGSHEEPYGLDFDALMSSHPLGSDRGMRKFRELIESGDSQLIFLDRLGPLDKTFVQSLEGIEKTIVDAKLPALGRWRSGVLQPLREVTMLQGLGPVDPTEVSPNAAQVAFGSRMVAANVNELATDLSSQVSSVSGQEPSAEAVTVKARTMSDEVQRIAVSQAEAAEKDTTENDVANATSDYLAVVSDCQTVSDQVKEIAVRLAEPRRIGWETIRHLIESIKDRIGKLLTTLKSLIDKDAAALWRAITDFAEAVKDGAEDKIHSFLKNLSDRLRGFAARLIGLIFSFAVWVQGIAERKNFNLKQLEVQLPTLQSELVNVGPLPLPIPKLTTPVITITFEPRSSTL